MPPITSDLVALAEDRSDSRTSGPPPEAGPGLGTQVTAQRTRHRGRRPAWPHPPRRPRPGPSGLEVT
jgi:hypothetical protein